jgi:hypothetical protein
MKRKWFLQTKTKRIFTTKAREEEKGYKISLTIALFGHTKYKFIFCLYVGGRQQLILLHVPSCLPLLLRLLCHDMLAIVSVCLSSNKKGLNKFSTLRHTQTHKSRRISLFKHFSISHHIALARHNDIEGRWRTSRRG